MATLNANKRTGQGTRDARRIRAAGRIPGVIYGHGQTPVSVTLDRHDLDVAVHHGERLLELDIEGAKENVLIKELQYDPFQQDVIHVDLARVNLDERVQVTVPIVLRGTPAAASDGGVVTQTIAQAQVECLVTNIPDDIRFSVTEMKLGDVLRIKDLPLPEGTKILNDPEAIVASVVLIAEEVVAPAAVEEGAGEPEVIGAKKEEEGAEEGAEAPKGEKKEKEKKE